MNLTRLADELTTAWGYRLTGPCMGRVECWVPITHTKQRKGEWFPQVWLDFEQLKILRPFGFVDLTDSGEVCIHGTLTTTEEEMIEALMAEGTSWADVWDSWSNELAYVRRKQKQGRIR